VAESVRGKAELLAATKEQAEVELEQLRRRLADSDRDRQMAQQGERTAREAAISARTHAEALAGELSQLKLDMHTRAQEEQERRFREQQSTRSTTHAEGALEAKLDAVLQLVAQLPSTLQEQAELAQVNTFPHPALPRCPFCRGVSCTSHFRTQSPAPTLAPTTLEVARIAIATTTSPRTSGAWWPRNWRASRPRGARSLHGQIARCR
jgi:hypothetical protein